ncbi:MAG: IS21-like element helper ATPase IstB [Desulfuromonadales bacterium]|nr:IS21-like element helper ATPase IstB [Desulfuromonadales bacterium]
MLNEQTKSKLYAMKLQGMVAAYEEQTQNPRAADLSFDERLGLLVDRQWTWREDRSLKGRLQHAKFKLNACVEDLDFRASRGLKRSDVERLLGSDWLQYHQGVIITGPTGTGKTFLACAIGQKACREGYRVRYYVASKLFRQLAAAHADGSFGRLSVQLQKTALLIVDDWGMEKLSDEQYRDFLEILDDRHGCGSTLITSQFPLSLWHDTIGNPTVADAILDRLINTSQCLELKGESLRTRPAQTTPATASLPPSRQA